MGNSDEYRLVGNNHYHDGERKMEGDVFVPTESHLNRFPNKFEPVEETAESDESDEGDEGNRGEDSSTESEESEPFDPSEYTLSELEAELEDADIDASSDELHEREKDSKDRTGAHKIIDGVVTDE